MMRPFAVLLLLVAVVLCDYCSTTGLSSVAVSSYNTSSDERTIYFYVSSSCVSDVPTAWTPPITLYTVTPSTSTKTDITAFIDSTDTSSLPTSGSVVADLASFDSSAEYYVCVGVGDDVYGCSDSTYILGDDESNPVAIVGAVFAVLFWLVFMLCAPICMCCVIAVKVVCIVTFVVVVVKVCCGNSASARRANQSYVQMNPGAPGPNYPQGGYVQPQFQGGYAPQLPQMMQQAAYVQPGMGGYLPQQGYQTA
ncbi:hypothetical protein J8273_8797 [Carpediemonas membranifera]|uniref:Uncharacterized protein n=1 Tax=Carpediemonas membranifera TaxID=201153 RepID=A0A8J6AZ52_9EUKA|nr:hypothetical protein J8273_8797 [Carpediemonas membranifera]|eukprot:KAG9389504.1 hypothetical protein J8273_8797 [Carpediemonas membranifera]